MTNTRAQDERVVMDDPQHARTRENSGGVVRTLLKFNAAILALLIMAQALFAGRGMFIDPDDIEIHAAIGNGTFVVALIQVALVLVAGFRGRRLAIAAGTALSLLALVIVQMALGYTGRDHPNAAAWHVPMGVLIFGIAVFSASFLTLGAGSEDQR
jgi:Na+/H+ antiporter NhaD/arsenite permease-like protein